jgi:hypothetical protein
MLAGIAFAELLALQVFTGDSFIWFRYFSVVDRPEAAELCPAASGSLDREPFFLNALNRLSLARKLLK